MSELHPLLATRWSPLAFDPVAVLSDEDVGSLLEAARWAPSFANSQPWRFAVGRRDEETYKRILENLSTECQRWAGNASALIVAAHLDDAALPHAPYDLGQAVAHLTVQATALRLHVHQIADFDGDGLRSDLEMADDLRPSVVVAIGRLGDPAILPPDLRTWETALRTRASIAQLLVNQGSIT
ncbi:nitroreductase family protein [Phytohabitans sp. ZYX-F-186]|uniref:Nitroreductase family protein n=1 Tax=Phytohabitans maris TaxID=3071409 RepID=A0ABU0ZIL1_9ACTN|nr:nitroreductase family protein [Phytohabitans sp. ZYX-F-186]MDQ7906886.1 nitroreductase family protein [Phytohabitans sp. ZYX-F-186]